MRQAILLRKVSGVLVACLHSASRFVRRTVIDPIAAAGWALLRTLAPLALVVSLLAMPFGGDAVFAKAMIVFFLADDGVAAAGSEVRFARGVLNLGTGAAGTTHTVTCTDAGGDFQPKAIWVSWNPQNTTQSEGGGTARYGSGFATGTTERGCLGAVSVDAADPMRENVTILDDCLAFEVNDDGGAIGKADVDAILSTGFRLIIDVQFNANRALFWTAIGGSSVSAKTGWIQEAGGTGDQAYTGVGFQPNLVAFLGSPLTSAPPATADNSTWSIGAAAGTGSNQFVMAGGARDAVGTSECATYITTGECIALYNATLSDLDARASLTSFDSDGFTLNWIERASTRQIAYLAVAGLTNAAVSTINASTSVGGDVAKTGLGFQPKLVMGWANRLTAASTAGTPTLTVVWHWGMGACVQGSQGSCCIAVGDNTAAADVGAGIAGSHIMKTVFNTGALAGLFQLQSLDADGYTIRTGDAENAILIVTVALA